MTDEANIAEAELAKAMTPLEQANALLKAAEEATPMIYVASRASIPERPAMWRKWRMNGAPIISTWIDEAGEGETESNEELWVRILNEISRASSVILYAEQDDFPLKGALIEVGMALGMGKPITCCLPGVTLQERSFRPVGSWMAHPLVTRNDDVESALKDASLARNTAPAIASALLEKHKALEEALGLLRETLDLAWISDSREVIFDNTVMFGLGYDFGGLEGPRREEFLAAESCLVWPAYGVGGKWSAYCTHEGLLWFEKFDTKEAAKDACMNYLAHVLPEHPALKARAFLARQGETA